MLHIHNLAFLPQNSFKKLIFVFIFKTRSDMVFRCKYFKLFALQNPEFLGDREDSRLKRVTDRERRAKDMAVESSRKQNRGLVV
jgi:hypothetical protein